MRPPPIERAARLGLRAGPWFDHALVLVLVAVILADVWLASYLLFVTLGIG